MKTSRIWSSAVSTIVAATTTMSAMRTPPTDNANIASANAQSNEIKTAATTPTSTDVKTGSKPPQAPAIMVPEESVSWAISELIKMSQSGVGDPVILAYVHSSEIITPPTGNEIIYLHQKGFSSEIINAVIRKGAELQAKRASTSAAEIRTTPMTTEPVQVVSQAVPVQAPTVTYPTITYYNTPAVVPSTYYYSEPPIYYTSYPRYSYSSWYWNSPFISYSGYYPIGYNRGYSHSYNRINSFRSYPPMHSARPGRNFSSGPGRGISAQPPRGISGPGRNFSTGPGRGFSAPPGRGSPGPGRRGR